MSPHITLKLYATLQTLLPAAGEDIIVTPGMTIQDLLRQIGLPEEKAQLIFIDGVKGDLLTTLKGGERVGIFPPVGGG
jgi:molybdopterin converting factor small subunit